MVSAILKQVKIQTHLKGSWGINAQKEPLPTHQAGAQWGPFPGTPASGTAARGAQRMGERWDSRRQGYSYCSVPRLKMRPCGLQTPRMKVSWWVWPLPCYVTEHDPIPASPGVQQRQEASHSTELTPLGCCQVPDAATTFISRLTSVTTICWVPRGWGSPRSTGHFPSSTCAPEGAGVLSAAQRTLGALRSGLGSLVAPEGVAPPLWYKEGLFLQLTDK